MCNVVLISCFLDNVRKNKCSTEYNPCVFQVCVAFFRHRWRFAGAENTTSLAQYCSSLVIHSCQTEAVLSRFGVCYTHQLSENSVPSLRFFDSVTTTLISSGSTLTPTQPVLSHLPTCINPGSNGMCERPCSSVHALQENLFIESMFETMTL